MGRTAGQVLRTPRDPRFASPVGFLMFGRVLPGADCGRRPDSVRRAICAVCHGKFTRFMNLVTSAISASKNGNRNSVAAAGYLASNVIVIGQPCFFWTQTGPPGRILSTSTGPPTLGAPASIST